MAFTKITESDMSGKGNVGRSDTPGVSTTEMQRIMDELSREVIVPKFNAFLDDLAASAAAASVGASAPSGLTANETVQAVLNAVYAALTGHTGDTANPHGVTAEQTGAYTSAQTDAAITAQVVAIGAGDMAKAVYDADNDGVVDDAEKLGGALPAHYASAAALAEAMERAASAADVGTVSGLETTAKTVVPAVNEVLARMGGLTLAVVTALPEDAADHPDTLYLVTG